MESCCEHPFERLLKCPFCKDGELDADTWTEDLVCTSCGEHIGDA